MGSINEKLAYLKETKNKIKEAIIAKGVAVDDNTTFTSYPNKIAQIETGTKINNQDKTITANGSYTADEGYTGLGTVTVNVSSETPVGDFIKVTEETFVRPTFTTSSQNGSLGGDKFAVISTSGENLWQSCDNDENPLTSFADAIIYNPEPLKITNIKITDEYMSPDGYYWQPKKASISASYDGSTWETLLEDNTGTRNYDLSDNKGYYYYYKIIAEENVAELSSYDGVQVGEVHITGKYLKNKI